MNSKNDDDKVILIELKNDSSLMMTRYNSDPATDKWKVN